MRALQYGWLLISGAVLIVGGAEAAERERVVAALERMDTWRQSRWAYTRTAEARDHRSVARHDPLGTEVPFGWELLEVDGAPPKEKDKNIFYDLVAREREGEKSPEGVPRKLTDFVPPGTLSFARKDEEGRTVFRFTPGIDDSGDDRQGVLSGELTFDAATGRVETIRVRNEAAYSPKFGVKIHQFVMDLKFAAFGPRIAVVAMRIRIKGKGGFFRSFDEDIRLRFTDYEWVGEEWEGSSAAQ